MTFSKWGFNNCVDENSPALSVHGRFHNGVNLAQFGALAQATALNYLRTKLSNLIYRDPKL